MEYRVWRAMLKAYHKVHPKPKSITELKEALQLI